MAHIAWLGLGSMGAPMARNLINAGYRVHAFDPAPGRYAAVEGVHGAASPAQAARGADLIFTSVPDPAALQSCLLGDDGAVSVLEEGQIILDMSTVSIGVSAQCDRAVRARGGTFLCAPVGGGADMAQAAQLTVMCSGDREAYDRALPLLRCLSKAQYYLGEGYGARAMKLAHNMMLAGQMQLLAEALAFCEKAQVDPDAALDILGGSALNSPYLSFKAPEIRDRSFRLTSMPVRMLDKDLRLAMECMDTVQMTAPVTALVKQLLDSLNAQGYGDRDPSWLVLQMEQMAGLHPKEFS